MKKKTKARRGKATRRPSVTDEPRPPEAGNQRRDVDDLHDAAHPGGLPDLEAKTETEAEHDTWWRHA